MNNKNNDAHLAAANDVGAVEVDIEKCSPMKAKLYRVSDELESRERDRRTISVYDYDDSKIITYSSPTTLEMTRSMPNKDTNDEDNKQYYTYEYIPSPQFHKLHHIFVTLKLFEIQVIPEYEDNVQIRFCDNLIHNVVTDAIISFPYKDGLTEGVYNHRVNTFYNDSYRNKDCLTIKKYDYDIGNRKSLVKWSNALKTRDELFLPLKFFIDSSEKYAIPIHMYNNPNNIKITITYCLALESLIQMRVKNEQGWEIIPPDLKFLQTNDTELKAPKVWGDYRMLLKKELAMEKEGYRILISDNKYLEDEEITKDFNIDLTDEKAVVRQIRYGFLNYKASLFNNHSNYTLDHNNRRQGDDPQEDFSLSYGNVPRITKRSNIHSTRTPDHYHHISDCNEHGIHDIRFDLFSYSIYPDTGVVMDKKSILSGSLRTFRKKTVENGSKKKLPKKSSDDIIGTALIKKQKQFSEQEVDDSISEKFIFKGYCKVFKYLTFKVGTIIIEE